MFGIWNKKENFKARIIQKSNNAKTTILQIINRQFMFSGLNDGDKSIIVDAMEEKVCKSGKVIIREGDEGDCLYVVGSGTLKCSKVFKGQTSPTFLKRYESGEAFGELALLYNVPRAATI